MKYLRQEMGYSMLLVILTILLISILGLSLLTINANSLKTSKNEETDQAVFYIAEAGINYYVEEINSLIDSVYYKTLADYNRIVNIEQKNSFNFENTLKLRIKDRVENYINTPQPYIFNKFISNINNKYAKLLISWKDDTSIEFISTGNINNKTRTLTQTLIISLEDAILKKPKTVTIGPSGEVSSGDPSPSNDYLITDPKYPTNTPLYVNKPLDKSKFKFGVGQISGFDQNNLLSKNDFNSKFKAPHDIKNVVASKGMTISESMKLINFANISSSSDPIKIDASKNDITIYIDNDFNSSTPFEISGNKNVNIIISANMNLAPGFSLTKSNGAEVNMLVKGHVNFNTGNGNEVLIQSNIIALNSPFNLSSNKLTIDGNLFTYTESDMAINGSNNAYVNGLCAPYAKLNVSGTYNINGGSIVVNELNYNGGASLNYLGKNPPKNSCVLPTSLNNNTTGTYYDYDKVKKLFKLGPLIEK